HEMDAAEDDGAFFRFGSDAREREGITDVIGDVLDGGQLVVVREQCRVAFAGQPTDLFGPLRCRFDAGVTAGAVDDGGGSRPLGRGHGLAPSRVSSRQAAPGFPLWGFST